MASRFVATVAASVAPYVQLQQILKGLIQSYDIQTAVGVQLDVIGQWVGQSRSVRVPLVGVYFAWNDVNADGWDRGSWQGLFDPTSGLLALPDDSYRTLLLAMIQGNRWDGSVPTADATLARVFGPSTTIVIEDHQDMSMTVAVSGIPLSATNLGLLTQGELQIRPMGVQVVAYAILPSTGLLFAWDIPANSVYAGWGVGQWAVMLAPV
jgi:Protein of unknown function (DUF2612)